jgi:hypothetical protein
VSYTCAVSSKRYVQCRQDALDALVAVRVLEGTQTYRWEVEFGDTGNQAPVSQLTLSLQGGSVAGDRPGRGQ